jgi:hypothetical protein
LICVFILLIGNNSFLQKGGTDNKLEEIRVGVGGGVGALIIGGWGWGVIWPGNLNLRILIIF